MSHKVYLLTSLGAPRDHHSLYICTDPTNRTGFIYQVSGNIQSGMYFNHRETSDPEKGAEFLSMECIGTVSTESYESGKVREAVERVEPPGTQFEGPKRLVPEGRLRRCREWTAEVVELLRREGVLEGSE